MPVEKNPTWPVDKMLVCAVIQQKNAGLSERRSRPGFHDTRVKCAWTTIENGFFRGVFPVEQITRRSKAHIVARLTIRIFARAQVVHPPFPVDLFWNDCAGFRPLYIPSALICRHDHAR